MNISSGVEVGDRVDDLRILIVWRAQFLGAHGGMERVCSNMANHFCRNDDEVEILYCNKNNRGEPYFPLENNVKLVNMLAGVKDGHAKVFPFWAGAVREFLRIFNKDGMFTFVSKRKNGVLKVPVRKEIERFHPQAIISFDPETTLLLRESLGYGCRIPVITMFHFPLSRSIRNKSGEEYKAIRSSYASQLLTEDAEQEFQKVFPGAKSICIPNVVLPCDIPADLRDKKDHRIVYVARFGRDTKRQHILVRAFSSLASRFPDWKLYIYGSHGDKYAASITDFIHEKELDEQIHVEPPTKDIYAVCRMGDIVGFPSAYEGFGLALAEAMNAGLPAVGFRSAAGVNRLIKDGNNGFLADDSVESFADKLRLLMENDSLRVQMGESARKSVEKFLPDHVWKQWDSLLLEAVENGK